MTSSATSTATWHALTLQATPQWAEACAELLHEAGCDGVEIRDLRVQFDESEDATLVPLPEVEVVGYWHGDALAVLDRMAGELRAALERGAIPALVRIEAVQDNDWANSWREYFPPLRAGRFLIAPPWSDETPREDEIEIRIDPGLAFGTGQHPTTRLCLECLSDYLPPAAPATLLDVGCGSGILSIAAAKLLSTTRIVACDPDGFCVEATEENAQRNGVTLDIHQRPGAAWAATRFDVVVANLMSALLISLRDELAGAVVPGGLLIVSGISSPRADEVEAALNGAGFETVERRMAEGEHRDDYVERWAAFVLRADAAEKG